MLKFIFCSDFHVFSVFKILIFISLSVSHICRNDVFGFSVHLLTSIFQIYHLLWTVIHNPNPRIRFTKASHYLTNRIKQWCDSIFSGQCHNEKIMLCRNIVLLIIYNIIIQGQTLRWRSNTHFGFPPWRSAGCMYLHYIKVLKFFSISGRIMSRYNSKLQILYYTFIQCHHRGWAHSCQIHFWPNRLIISDVSPLVSYPNNWAALFYQFVAFADTFFKRSVVSSDVDKWKGIVTLK